MANIRNTQTKMVMEYEDAQGKKTRWTFGQLQPSISNAKFVSIANALGSIQTAQYDKLFKTVESEIY